MLLGTVSSASVTNFFPTVVQTLGYPRVQTLLLTSPPYILAVICTFLNAWHADRTGERFWHIALPALVGIAAFILAAASRNTAARYLAMMLMLPGVYTGYVVQLAWISNSLPRPPAKRAAALAFINAVSNASSIYASYMYAQPTVPGEAIDLVVPMSVDCATLALAVAMAVLLRGVLRRLNAKLDRGEFVDGAVNAGAAIPGEAARKGFRFLV